SYEHTAETEASDSGIFQAGTVTSYLGRKGAGKTRVFGRRYRELKQPISHVGAVSNQRASTPAAADATTAYRAHMGANTTSPSAPSPNAPTSATAGRTS